jgi:hypothetical protein
MPSRHSLPHRLLTALLMAACASAFAPDARAADGESVDDIEWHGFLNVVGGMLQHAPPSEDNPDSRHPSRLNYTDTLSIDEETSAGLQATRRLEGGDSVTLQLFAKGSEENYAAQTKWLYYNHQIDAQQRIKVGRIGTPIYYYSDYLNVGYAYHWVTPPRVVYFFDATLTGLDYTYRFGTDRVDAEVEVFAGSADQYQAVIDANTSQRNVRGLIGTVTWDNRLTLRAMMMRQLYSLEFQSLNTDDVIDQGFEAAVDSGLLDASLAATLKPVFAPDMRPLIDEVLLIEDRELSYQEAALRYEEPDWFVMMEAIRAKTDLYLISEDTRAWYLSGGIRTGRLLWHLTWSKMDQPICDQCKADYTLTQGPLPGSGLAQFFARKIRSEAAIQEADHAENWSAGVTIESSANSLLKFELEKFSDIANVPTETAGIGSNIIFRTALCVTF